MAGSSSIINILGLFIGIDLHCFEIKAEYGAVGDVFPHRNGPAMGRDYRAAKGQAQPQAAPAVSRGFGARRIEHIEYLFPDLGWGELMGIASRTDYDLKRHMEYSKEDLTYLDPDTHERYIPHVIEPSFGLDRLALALLVDSYDCEELEKDSRIVMRLKSNIAPYKVAIMPLSNKLNDECQNKLWKLLSSKFDCVYDVTGSIGKRYRRQDAIGTPFCITYDFDSINDGSVTVRERDSMKQERVKISELVNYIENKLDEDETI